MDYVKLELACPKDHVLFHVDVVVYDSDTTWRTGDLIERINDCHWQQKCEIPFPTDSVIVCLDDKSTVLCPGFRNTRPDSIEVRRVKCAKEAGESMYNLTAHL